MSLAYLVGQVFNLRRSFNPPCWYADRRLTGAIRAWPAHLYWRSCRTTALADYKSAEGWKPAPHG